MRKILFSENLKYYRRQKRLSRRELAECLSYSDKAVEKWESGDTVPTLSVICQLAELLEVELEVLVYGQAPSVKYYLGIDGGGTKTAFLLENEQGDQVAEYVAGPSNPNDIGWEACDKVLKEGLAAVCGDIDRKEIALFAGIAGVGSGNNSVKLQRLLNHAGFGFLAVGSDVDTALEAAIGDEDGVSLIMGTGVIAFAQVGGRKKKIAGWGYLLDSAGSGYNIGRDVLEAALRMVDGRGGADALMKQVEKQLGCSLPDAIPTIYTGGKRLIASFAPLAFDGYRAGDEFCRDILYRNFAAVAEIIEASYNYIGRKDVPVVICGGLGRSADVVGSILKEMLPECKLSFLQQQLVTGAVLSARRKYEKYREA